MKHYYLSVPESQSLFSFRLKRNQNKETKMKNFFWEVTNAENIKADRPKILRPTHFSCIKNIKAEKLVVGVVP